MNTMTARDLRDVGTSKLPSLNASSTRTERMITSCRTVSSTRNPFLSNFPWIQTISTIRWRAPWTMKVCMPHSLLLSHDKFMLHKLRTPRFALSCNSRKKTRKKDPLTNSPIMKRLITNRMEVVHREVVLLSSTCTVSVVPLANLGVDRAN